jgi:hypothetical protein
MPDLFVVPDDRFLLAKWDHLIAVFRIVAREYRQVLSGLLPPDRHRTILIQTVSDLLDLETDLHRLGKRSPADGFDGWLRDAWRSAAVWVAELRVWRFPHESMPVDDIEQSLVCRKHAEERFNAVVSGGSCHAVDDPTVLVHTA